MSTTASEIILNADLAPNCGFRIEFCDACGDKTSLESYRGAWLWESPRWPCVSNGTRRPLVLCCDCVEMIKRRGLRGLERLICRKASRAQRKHQALSGFVNAMADLAAADVTIVNPIASVEEPF